MTAYLAGVQERLRAAELARAEAAARADGGAEAAPADGGPGGLGRCSLVGLAAAGLGLPVPRSTPSRPPRRDRRVVNRPSTRRVLLQGQAGRGYRATWRLGPKRVAAADKAAAVLAAGEPDPAWRRAGWPWRRIWPQAGGPGRAGESARPPPGRARRARRP